MTSLPELKFSNEYCVDEPTWWWKEDDLVVEFPPGLSEGLKKKILLWAQDFNNYFDHESGWPTGFDSQEHFEQGKRYAQELANELSGQFRILFHPWDHEKPDMYFEPKDKN